jgi:hypothetical protein
MWQLQSKLRRKIMARNKDKQLLNRASTQGTRANDPISQGDTAPTSGGSLTGGDPPTGGATLVAGANAAPVVLAIKVNFTLNTPDGLRRVIFGLEKDTQGDVVIWKISFQLFERTSKSDTFDDAIADLEVEVDHELHPQAAAAAASGLTPPQTAHATGPAADDVKSAEAGEIDESDAQSTVQNTLTV